MKKKLNDEELKKVEGGSTRIVDLDASLRGNTRGVHTIRCSSSSRPRSQIKRTKRR